MDSADELLDDATNSGQVAEDLLGPPQGVNEHGEGDWRGTKANVGTGEDEGQKAKVDLGTVSLSARERPVTKRALRVMKSPSAAFVLQN